MADTIRDAVEEVAYSLKFEVTEEQKQEVEREIFNTDEWGNLMNAMAKMLEELNKEKTAQQ